MKNSPLLKFGLALLFAVSAGSMICSPANAFGNAGAIFNQVMNNDKKAPLTDEQLEKKAPDLETLFVHYTNPLYEKITKDQFINYVRTHNELKEAAKKHKRSPWIKHIKTLTDEQLNKLNPNFDELVHLYVAKDKITQLQFVNYVESHKDLK